MEASAKPDFFCSLMDNYPQLERKHKYYSQVQGQLAIGGRQWCDFVVYTSQGISIECIPFNKSFCDTELLPKLFNSCEGPEIVDSMQERGMPMHDLR